MNKGFIKNKLVRNYLMIILFYTIIDKLYGTIYVGHMASNGLNEATIGVILAVSSLALSLFDYPSGNFADKFGRKKVMLIGFLIWGLSLFLYAISTNTIHFILVLILWALAISLISGSPDAWFVDEAYRVKNEQLIEVMPKVNSISLIIGAIAAVMVTILTDALGNKSPFYIAAILSVIIVIIMSFSMNENYGNKEITLKRALIKNTMELLKNPILKVNLLRAMIGRIPFLVFVMSWQLYLLNYLNISFNSLGFILGIFIFLLALGNYIAAYLIKKFEGIIVSVIGHFTIILGCITLIFTDNIWMFMLGAGLIEIGLGIDSGAVMVWVQKIIPSESRASLMSGMYAISSLCGFFIPLISGAIISKFGYQMIWVFCSASSIITIYILFKMKSMQKEKAVQELMLGDES